MNIEMVHSIMITLYHEDPENALESYTEQSLANSKHKQGRLYGKNQAVYLRQLALLGTPFEIF